MKPPGFFSRQAFLHWAELVVLILLFTGVLVLANYIAYKRLLRFDMTPEKRYTLSQQTISLLDSLADDIHATVFYKQRERRELESLVELFARTSNRFHYNFIELDKNPAKAQTLGITSYGGGIIESKDRREKVQYFTEENLVSAIIRLTEEGEKIVRFVKGHGEKDITSSDPKNGYSSVKRALESENYRVEDILLMQVEKVPEDTLILIVSGPQKDFFQKELNMLDAYIKNGGRVLILCEPSPLPNIENFLRSFQIKLAHDFIIDTRSKLVALDHLTPIILPDKGHPIAKYMNDVVVFPVCRSVAPAEGSEAEVFCLSSPDSWAEQDSQSVYNDQVRFDRGKDLRGPISVAISTLIKSPESESSGTEPGRLVVIGDSDFVSNHYINVLANKDLFLNTVNWLAEKSALLATRIKAEPSQAPISMLFLTENESRLILWSSVIIEPGIILLIGLCIVLWRRIKR